MMKMKKKKTKVKQHYRKTKKGKTKVKEHKRKVKNRSASGQCPSCGRVKKLDLRFRMCHKCIKDREKEIINLGAYTTRSKTYEVTFKQKGKDKDLHTALVRSKNAYPNILKRKVAQYMDPHFNPVIKKVKRSEKPLRDKEFEYLNLEKDIEQERKKLLKKLDLPEKTTERVKKEELGEGYIEIAEGEVRIPKKFRMFGARGCPYCKGDPNKVCPVCETKERPWMGPFRIRSSGSGLGDRMKAEEHLFELNKELRKKTDKLSKLTDGDPLKQEKLVKEIKVLKKRINVFTGKEEW
jgi:glutaredoxin